MMHCYEMLWPDHPFVFHVPYQKYPFNLKEKYGNKIKLIKTPSDINSTMNILLNKTDNDEWIYWSMDDRYPVHLNVNQILEICKWIKKSSGLEISGVNFTHMNNIWNSDNLMLKKYVVKDFNKNQYYRIKNFNFIWFHQFIRARILKYLFNNMPDELVYAKQMDHVKDKLYLPKKEKLYVSYNRYAVFGESTNRGKLTLNLVDSMKKHGFKIPSEFDINNKKIFKGSKWHERPRIYFFLRNKYRYLIKFLNEFRKR